jgi:hypothetical protein
LVFEKNANFSAENGQKSQKIVIITSTPGLIDNLKINKRFLFKNKLNVTGGGVEREREGEWIGSGLRILDAAVPVLDSEMGALNPGLPDGLFSNQKSQIG